jgi:hypothetical protein
MDLKQNPFSFYDFLGYFTPGALFAYAALLMYGHAVHPTTPLATIESVFGPGHAELYVPFVLSAYVIGHFLSFVSSVTVERYSVWTLGYPSKYLLGQPYPSFFEVAPPKFLRTVGHTIGSLVLAPVSLLDLLLGRLLNVRDLYAKPLDPFLIETIKDKVTELVIELGLVETATEKGGLRSHDYFRIAYHFAVENCPAHYPKMQNYVALYGFLRTVTLVLVMIFWLYVWHAIRHPSSPYLDWPLLIGIALLTYTSYAAFIKFYRRFTLEALMAISARIKRV